VVLVASAVENDQLDAGRSCPLGNRLADHFGRGDVAATLQLLAHLLVERARRGKRAAGVIVNYLRVDVAERAIYAQPRPLRRPGNPGAHPQVNPLAVRVAR